MGDLEFHIWDAAAAQDRTAWIEWWRRWPGREVFAHPDYLLLYATPHALALCAAASVGDRYVLYPFLLRALGEEQYCDASLRECVDITSPYGYGGPFVWGKTWDEEACSTFWHQFDEWATQKNVISEVIRLSLFPETLMPYAGTTSVVSQNVVRTLTIGVEELWQDFEYKVRKNVNRARANNVVVQIDESGERLDDFLRIYLGTLDRREAGAAYYFTRDYFECMNSALNGQFAYFHAFTGSVVISTELVLVSADRIYSFLGGTDAAFYRLRPNDLLKVEIMNWARQAGKKEFVLGGGYTTDDGIFRYKLSFAPGGQVPFSIGSRIFCPEACERLVESRRALAAKQGCMWNAKPDFFPAYRS